MKNIWYILVLIYSGLLISCSNSENDRYTIIENNGIVYKVIGIDTLLWKGCFLPDEQRKIIDDILSDGYISDTITSNFGFDSTLGYTIETESELLPYFIYMLSHAETLPQYALDRQTENFIDLNFNTYTDSSLVKLAKNVVNSITSKRSLSNIVKKKAKNLENIEISPRSEYIHYTTDNESLRLDSLIVRVVAHNDRNALARLEQYYNDKGNPKGIAIYYKVLLSYDGNGDLAERFYKVLEPYYDETPEFRRAVRETLLRAALCDQNERAQQLCDSLGFSLCDYKLPTPINN